MVRFEYTEHLIRKRKENKDKPKLSQIIQNMNKRHLFLIV